MTFQQIFGYIVVPILFVGGVLLVIRASTTREVRLRKKDRHRRKSQERRFRERLQRCPRCWRRTLRVQGDHAYCQSTACAYSRGFPDRAGSPSGKAPERDRDSGPA